jgi:small-conductance mechanosensitive channel
MNTVENILQSYVLPITFIFLIAWLAQLMIRRVIRRFFDLTDYYAPEKMRPREQRQHTLFALLSSAITVIAFTIAGVLSLGRFVDATTLVWMIGLFSAAFGLGSHRLISDFVTGIGFIFEDTFDVGEKVEILGVEGKIEKINLRTTTLRATTGELYIIPNGEIRMIRNFSRGRYSTANITIKVNTADLNRVLPLLEDLGTEAVSLLPNLLEPWQVISPSGATGKQAELTLVTKARFGKAAEMRPRLLALVHQRLAEADIELVN